MKYLKPYWIVKNGNALTIHLTEAIRMAGWDVKTPVNVSVTDDDKIMIEKVPTQ